MSQLTILNSSIRSLNSLYSLNDLQRISGAEEKHRPSLFIRLDTTRELVTEITKEVKSTDLIFKTTGGRGMRGTWACEELVLAYAMWISPKFHLIVLRAFIAMHKGEAKPQQIALPEPEKNYTRTFTEKELHILSVVMDKYVPMVTEFCNNVETQQRNVYKALGLPPLQNNPLAARAYSINHEFRYWTDEAREIIKRIKPPKNYALGNF